MVVISPGWRLDVERGPDWLIVAVDCDHDDEWGNPPLAECVWQLLEQSFTYRVVLDLSRLEMLHTYLVGQLVCLQRRAAAHDGLVRICGLTDRNRDVLRCCRLDGYFPHYHDRVEAILGTTAAIPLKPR